MIDSRARSWRGEGDLGDGRDVVCWALHSTIWARRHRTTDPDPLRTIKRSFLPSSWEISLARRARPCPTVRDVPVRVMNAPLKTLPVTARPAASLCPTRRVASHRRAHQRHLRKEKSPDTHLPGGGCRGHRRRTLAAPPGTIGSSSCPHPASASFAQHMRGRRVEPLLSNTPVPGSLG